ncbi:MAG: DNA polymerase II large subunit [Euryarchaeota archaeon]|nr:DNA polymerase II large subunit [Euryarchaeota archaeon]
MAAYFKRLETATRIEYQIAERARSQGLDPETKVEVPPAEDLAARVEAQVEIPGVAKLIRDETKQGKNREEVALAVSKTVARDWHAKTGDRRSAVDKAIRTGLSILTEGITVAPLDGISETKLRRNVDGTEYVSILFAGPIRSAGGTAQALSVLIGDLARRDLGLARYIPSQDEIDRYKEEIPAYKQEVRLQYSPSDAEVELVVRNCPVSIDGEGTQDREVTGKRDLPRLDTNQLRGGMALVLAEGVCQKAAKIQKHVKTLGMDGWEFIDELMKKGKKAEPGAKTGAKPEITPNHRFMDDLIAGRPVFSHPSCAGGFRLRYGRARTAGLASTAIHPATMFLLDEFLAVGTQMKIERPGKGTVVTPCDTIEGPMVLLASGALVEVGSTAEAVELRPLVKRVVDLGEILIPFGEFAENNAVLPQSPYCVEWWEMEMRAAGNGDEQAGGTTVSQSAGPKADAGTPDSKTGPVPSPSTAEEAFALAEKSGVALHPRFNLFWHDLSARDMAALSQFVEDKGRWERGTLVLPAEAAMKELLVTLGALHDVRNGENQLGRHSYSLLRGLGLDVRGETMVRRVPLAAVGDERDPLAIASKLAGVVIKGRSPYRIGARMGRPEKAAERLMNPPVHSLFPIGIAGGAQRKVVDAAKGYVPESQKKSIARPENAGSVGRTRAADGSVASSLPRGVVEVEVGLRTCSGCGERTFANRCGSCGKHTLVSKERPTPQRVDLGELVDGVEKDLGLTKVPDGVKGVQGLISRQKTPEPLHKGVLRAIHGVYVFKDGTTRFDMTDVPLTHFRPREIHVDVKTLVDLGYKTDIDGLPLETDDQVLELFTQDLVVSKGCLEYLARTAAFMDDLLEKYYHLPRHYRLKKDQDLIGHLLVGLAPHTSGGVLGRLIGWTDAQAGFAHPFYHASKRRNCDGDEDCVMLLLDALVNFSRSYLPGSTGGLMDAPLVLATRIDPSEIDKEAHNIDVGASYPLAFYEATTTHPSPKDVSKLIDDVAKRLGKTSQYRGFRFTHDTKNIAEGPRLSAYKSLGTMMEKMEGQLELASKIRAVDAANVASRVIETHFLPDLIGNLRAFSKQSMRCTKCGTKYRRIPLAGVCIKEAGGRRCGNGLTMTVHEASVKKYLEVSKRISEKYAVDAYTRQRIELIEESMNSLFLSDKVKKSKLSDFM